MFTYDGIRKRKCHLEDNVLVVNGHHHIIENIKEKDASRFSPAYIGVMGLPAILVATIFSYKLLKDFIYTEQDISESILTLVFLLVFVGMAFLLMRFFIQSFSFRSIWMYNYFNMLIIVKNDEPHFESRIREMAHELVSSQKERSVRCPYCFLKTTVVPPGHYSCARCGATFSIKANYNIDDIKEPKFYRIIISSSLGLAVAYGLVSAFTDFFEPYLGLRFFFVLLGLGFGAIVIQGFHHGILPVHNGDEIYREQYPRGFYVAMIGPVAILLLFLFAYIEFPSINKQHDFNRFLNLGIEYAENGDYEKAIESYSTAIEIDSENPMVYYMRGFAYHNLKEYRNAVRDYGKAIDYDQNDPAIYYDRGLAYSKLKKYKQAVKDYSKAIGLNSNYSDAYYGRGIAYFNLGKYMKAVLDYDKAILLNPENRDVYNNRGYTYLSRLNEKDKACNDFKRACELGDCRNFNIASKDGLCK